MKSAVSLYGIGEPEVSEYYDRRSGLTREDYLDRLKVSSTLYVGNLSFKTMENQLLEIFNQCGVVINLVMGLNKKTYQNCGFCFVEYSRRQDAAIAVELLNKVMIDGRMIRVDWDYGFEP